MNSQSYLLFLLCFWHYWALPEHVEKRQVWDLMVLSILSVMAVAPTVI